MWRLRPNQGPIVIHVSRCAPVATCRPNVGHARPAWPLVGSQRKSAQTCYPICYRVAPGRRFPALSSLCRSVPQQLIESGGNPDGYKGIPATVVTGIPFSAVSCHRGFGFEDRAGHQTRTLPLRHSATVVSSLSRKSTDPRTAFRWSYSESGMTLLFKNWW